MKMTTDDADWRQYIINHLRERNRKECGFRDIITRNNRLLDNVAKLKSENLKLSVENEKLRSAVATGGGGKDSTATQLAISALEKKLLAQQEELTQLHKRKGENAQLIVDLKVKADKQQELIVEKDKSLKEEKTANHSLKAEVQMLKNNLEELKKLNTTLFDEHRALQLAFNSLEDKLRGVQNENNLLVERLMKYKTKDAEKLNEENEAIRRKRLPSFFRKKTDKLKRDLEDAVRETNPNRKSISPSRLQGGEAENGAVDAAYLAVELDEMLVDNNALASGFEGKKCPTIIYAKFEAHETESHAVRWSPMEPIIATGGADRKVKVWQMGKGVLKEPRAVLGGSSAGINSVDFDSKGAYILGTSNDYGARIWTTNDHRLRHTLTGHCGKVMAAKYVQEPYKVVTGSHDRTLKIWDLHSIACIETKFAGSSCNDLVSTDSLGSTIISGHYDKKIRFWDIRTEKQADDILMPSKVTSLDLSKDCNYLVCAVRDDTIRVLDLRKNQIFYTFTHENFRLSSDSCRVSLNMDCSKIACGSADGLIYVWNMNGFFENTLEGHCSPVYAVSWSPNSNAIASVGKGRKCIIYSDS